MFCLVGSGVRVRLLLGVPPSLRHRLRWNHPAQPSSSLPVAYELLLLHGLLIQQLQKAAIVTSHGQHPSPRRTHPPPE
jgi:hypothetical protein